MITSMSEAVWHVLEAGFTVSKGHYSSISKHMADYVVYGPDGCNVHTNYDNAIKQFLKMKDE
jgi:methyl coenzyme M reductase subunit D